MSFEINEALDHIEKSMGRLINEKTARYEPPRRVVDTIQTSIEAKGWSRFLNIEFDTVTLAGAFTSVQLTTTPDTEMRYHFMIEGFHDDAATAHVGALVMIQQPQAFQVHFTDGRSVIALQRIAATRPMLCPPRFAPQLVFDTPIPVGSNLNLQSYFVRLGLGEYVPASPYG